MDLFLIESLPKKELKFSNFSRDIKAIGKEK